MTVRIGLTGPIGCGKSTVAGWLGERPGGVVVDADQEARGVVDTVWKVLGKARALSLVDHLERERSAARPARRRPVGVAVDEQSRGAIVKKRGEVDGRRGLADPPLERGHGDDHP